MLPFISEQHLGDQLDLDLSALEYMMKCYPEIKDREEMRKIVGRFGLTGTQQVSWVELVVIFILCIKVHVSCNLQSL